MVEKERILEQYFITAKDLQKLTGIGINRCREIIKQARNQMLEEGCYLARSKPLEALTVYVLKMLGVSK